MATAASGDLRKFWGEGTRDDDCIELFDGRPCGYDDDGDSDGEPERRQTHDLLACAYEQEGDSGLSFIRAMPTYELEQRLAQEFEFHTWLVLRQRQWTSQQ